MEAMSGGKAAANRIIPGFDDRLNEEYEKTRMLEPLITADIRKVMSQLGTGLTGVEFSVKTGTSIADKLERAKQYADEARAKISFLGGKTAGSFDPHAELAQMKDVIRYTEICPHDDIISTTKRTIEEMKKQGYELSGIKNYYANPFAGTGYMGMHLNFVSPYGNEFELQVHSKESFDVKQKGHDLYEKIRAVGTRPEDKEEMRKEIRKIHQSIEKPKDYGSLKDFSMARSVKRDIMSKRRAQTDVSISSKKGDGPSRSMVYSVTKQGKKIACGFENVYSDGSMWRYQNDMRNGTAAVFVCNKKGAEISAHNAVPFEQTLGGALSLAAKIEERHAKWMKENFRQIDMGRSEQGIANTVTNIAK